MWIRIDKKSLSKKTLMIRADEISREEYKIRLQELSSETRDLLVERARSDLLRTVPPEIRILPVVAFSQHVLVGSRDVDPGVVALLERVFGPMSSDFLLWSEPLSWCSFSSNVARSFLDAEPIANGVSLSKIEIKKDNLLLRQVVDSEPAEDRLRSLLREVVDSEVSSMKTLGLAIKDGVDVLELEVDERGIFKADPPSSRGGLPAHRLLRRWDDILIAVRQVRSKLDPTSFRTGS